MRALFDTAAFVLTPVIQLTTILLLLKVVFLQFSFYFFFLCCIYLFQLKMCHNNNGNISRRRNIPRNETMESRKNWRAGNFYFSFFSYYFNF